MSDITSHLSTLTLQPKPPTFPSLPTELRLKIYTHLLPPHSTLRVGIHLISRDGSNYSYANTPSNIITFAVATSPFTSSDSNSPYTASSTSLVLTPRANTLLRISHETRTFYLSHFPHSLPCGRLGTGRVHFASPETIFIDNCFSNSLLPLHPALERQRSTLRGIETLALEDSMYGRKTRYVVFGAAFAEFVGLFADLRVLGCVSWYVGEEGMSNRGGCEEMVRLTREGIVGWKAGEGNDPWERVRVPEMVVIESW